MFRFTIREMFLLVLIVALGVGWWVDHRQMASDLADAQWWRHAAGAAESVLNSLGWKTNWNLSKDWFEAYMAEGSSSHGRFISLHEPSKPFPN